MMSAMGATGVPAGREAELAAKKEKGIRVARELVEQIQATPALRYEAPAQGVGRVVADEVISFAEVQFDRLQDSDFFSALMDTHLVSQHEDCSKAFDRAIHALEALFDRKQGITKTIVGHHVVRVCSAEAIDIARLPPMNNAKELVAAHALFNIQVVLEYLRIKRNPQLAKIHAAMMREFFVFVEKLQDPVHNEDNRNDEALKQFHTKLMSFPAQQYPALKSGALEEEIAEVRMWAGLSCQTYSMVTLDEGNHVMQVHNPQKVAEVGVLEPDIAFWVDAALDQLYPEAKIPQMAQGSVIRRNCLQEVKKILKTALGNSYDTDIEGEFTKRGENLSMRWHGHSVLTQRLFLTHHQDLRQGAIPTQLSYKQLLFREPLRNAWVVQQAVQLKDGSLRVSSSPILRNSTPTSRKPKSGDQAEIAAVRANLEQIFEQYSFDRRGSKIVLACLLSPTTGKTEPDPNITRVLEAVVKQDKRLALDNVPVTAKRFNDTTLDASGMLAEFNGLKQGQCHPQVRISVKAIQSFALGITSAENPFTEIKGQHLFAKLARKVEGFVASDDIQVKVDTLRQQYAVAASALNSLKLEYMGLCASGRSQNDPEMIRLADQIQYLDLILAYKAIMINHHYKDVVGARDPNHVCIPTVLDTLNGGYRNAQHDMTLLALEALMAAKAGSISEELMDRIYLAFCKSGKDRTGNFMDLVEWLANHYSTACFSCLEYNDNLQAVCKKFKIGVTAAATVSAEEAESQLAIQIIFKELKISMAGIGDAIADTSGEKYRDLIRKIDELKTVPPTQSEKDALKQDLQVLRSSLMNMSCVPVIMDHGYERVLDSRHVPRDLVPAEQAMLASQAGVCRMGHAAWIAGSKGGTRTCYGIVDNAYGAIAGTGRAISAARSESMERFRTNLANYNKGIKMAHGDYAPARTSTVMYDASGRPGGAAAAAAADDAGEVKPH